MPQYEAVIGIEIHAHISTKSKMFCSCSNNSFGKAPNSNICPICMGHPGQLPSLNEEALKKGIAAALAFKCQINSDTKFDRKNYFYPDLPKGYQISQFDLPLASKGEITIELPSGKLKKIRINRLHLEEDAGKLTHIGEGTLLDFNRSGVPLMEIVTEPDISSAMEASLYAQEIQKILRHIESSDADMEKGMMRFDINVSLREEGEKKLGVKSEVKNLNSFKSLEKAINYEINRQKELLSSGEKIIQETRGYDDEKEITVSQRSKEDSHDYRYFPEPDLPPLHFSKEEIENFKKLYSSELPSERKIKYLEKYGLKDLDASLLSKDKDLGDFFENNVELGADPKLAASLILSVLLGFMKRDNKKIADLTIRTGDLALLCKKVTDGSLSVSSVKNILETMYESGKGAEELLKKNDFTQISSREALAEICENVLKLNEQSIIDYKNGKERAFGYLVGQVMKESKGKANPSLINEILKEKIKKYV